jgi:hypothetical protein
MDVFSPLLTKKDVPETLWLPPEVRSVLEGEKSPSLSSRKSLLRTQLLALTERIEHVDSLLRNLNVENRLRRLDHGPHQEVDGVMEDVDQIEERNPLRKPQRGG